MILGDNVTENPVKVRVLGKHRVLHEGKPYVRGDEVSVPEATAAKWERSRWIDQVAGKR